MEKLQWFKFSPTDWVMGKIQRCPEVTQARYLRLVCLYWNKEGILSYEDAEIEIDKEHLDILIAKKVIKVENEFISINFLKEQLKEIKVDKNDKSQSGQIGNLKRWHRGLYDKFVNSELTLDEAVTKSKLSHPDSTPIDTPSQNIAEKSRVDKSREEESRVERKRVDKTTVFKPPLIEEVVSYFKEKGYNQKSGEKAFYYYDSAGWKDRNGTQVKNWKQKMVGNWFKDENKIIDNSSIKTLDDSKYYINKNGVRINRAAAS
jgi:hypothetical protein